MFTQDAYHKCPLGQIRGWGAKNPGGGGWSKSNFNAVLGWHGDINKKIKIKGTPFSPLWVCMMLIY
jgi:hypothetical protein